MLRTRRSRFNRTTAFLWPSFCPIPENISDVANMDDREGLRRMSLSKGSRRFGSNALTLFEVKQDMISLVKLPLIRWPSTLAVSSCSLMNR